MFQGKPQLIAFFASLAMSLGLCQIALAACGTAYCSDTIGTLYVAEGNVYIRPTNGTRRTMNHLAIRTASQPSFRDAQS